VPPGIVTEVPEVIVCLRIAPVGGVKNKALPGKEGVVAATGVGNTDNAIRKSPLR
jgi:hypothetical protein